MQDADLRPGFAQQAAGALDLIASGYGDILHRDIIQRAASRPLKSKGKVKGCSNLAICTANVTSGGAIPAILDSVDGRVWLVQEHHLLPAELRAKEAKWHSAGHKISLAPAISGKKADDPRSSSGGVGFAWGPGATLVHPLRVLAPGRLATIRLALPVLGEIELASFYGDVYSSEVTTELLKSGLEHLAETGKPGILAGDFNLRPDEVAEVIAAGGFGEQWRIAAPTGPTCFQGASRSTLDFFIVHASLSAFLGQLQVEDCWTWAPHKPVRMQLRVSQVDLAKTVTVWSRPPRPAGKPLLGPQLLPPELPDCTISQVDAWVSRAAAEAGKAGPFDGIACGDLAAEGGRLFDEILSCNGTYLSAAFGSGRDIGGAFKFAEKKVVEMLPGKACSRPAPSKILTWTRRRL